MAHPGGRPTKYNDDMILQAEEYMEMCGRENMSLPTIEGLALKLGIDDETVGLWARENPKFSATIKDLQAKQKSQLMDDGLYGGREVNSRMAIFLLKVNHNMVETTHTDITSGGKEIKPLVILDTKPDKV